MVVAKSTLKHGRASKAKKGPPKVAAATGALGLPARNAVELHRLIEEGVRYALLGKLQKALRLPLKNLAQALQIPMRTLSRRREEGVFSPTESERLLRLASLYDMAVDLFAGDAEAARRWLAAPRPALGGCSPLEFARTEIGAREVEDLMGRLEHGVFV